MTRIDENERIRQALEWCQRSRVAIDCTDGLWQISTWAGETEVRGRCYESFVDAAQDCCSQLGNVRTIDGAKDPYSGLKKVDPALSLRHEHTDKGGSDAPR